MCPMFNVRTLKSLIKIEKFTAGAEKHGIDVMCVQELRFYHEELTLKHHDLGKHW